MLTINNRTDFIVFFRKITQLAVNLNGINL